VAGSVASWPRSLDPAISWIPHALRGLSDETSGMESVQMVMSSILLSVMFSLARGATGDPDTDRDGLSDFHELHRYFTDPKKADSDGDGVPDGDWDERREFSYSVRAVLHVMAPFDVASMNDDYQDVRVLEQRPGLLEFEVVVYPLNTVAEAIEPDPGWRKPGPEAKAALRPGVCCNWDRAMQAELERELAKNGVDLGTLDDVEAAKKVSQWLMDRSQFEDSFTTFAVEFDNGKPRVDPRHLASVNEELRKTGRILEDQWDHELFGKGMFETRIHGSCTSSAIYLSTGLRAAGIPTRTIICVPIVDANDEREVGWVQTCITHVGVRSQLAKAVEHMRNSWSSHTFNEVLVGKRWRRLNYTSLGQNVLDDDTLGLMVHVNTYMDHSEAELVGWGNRADHPLHAALFGGPNPYSCVSLSDRFGAHAKVANEPFGKVRELTIERLYWYDDPKRPPELTTKLWDVESAGYFFAHFDTNGVDGSDALEFWLAVDQHFALRARGHDDIPAQGVPKFWGDSGDFILRIEPADFARMERGVEYELVWAGKDEALRWNVRKGVTIERPKR